MSLVRGAPRIIAAVASVIPFLVTYEMTTEHLQPEVKRLMEMPQVRMLLAYGVAYSTSGDAATAIVALALVLAASDTTPKKFFEQLTQLPPDDEGDA
jgi:hypothetical protein